MSWRYLPDSRDPTARPVDLTGQVLAVLSLAGLTLSWSRVAPSVSHRPPHWPWPSPQRCGILLVQRRIAQPMVPPQFFGDRRLVVALVATFAMTFGTYGMLLVNSLAFQGLRGVSALATAVAFLPMPLVYLALIPVVNVIARRTGPRSPMICGLVLMGAGMVLYAAVGPLAGLWLVETAFVLAGAGLAFNTGPAVGLAMAATPVARAGLASGVVNLARLVGITVGVAVMGSVLAWSAASRHGAGIRSGARAAVLTGGVAELLAATVVALGYTGTTRSSGAAPTKEACHA